MKKYLFLFLLLLISCKKTDSYVEKLSNKLGSLDNFNFNKYLYVFIIPGSGCTGCISEAEDFFFENHGNENFFFIFTKIHSLKILKLRAGDLLNRENVLIDQKDIFNISDNNTNIYPVIVNIKNKEKITYKIFDPGDNMQLSIE